MIRLFQKREQWNDIRSTEELERDAMLLALLATRSRGEKGAQAAIAGGGGNRLELWEY
jgi:hypothetical protein